MSPRSYLRSVVNAAAGVFRVRLVNADWGPRGVRETLTRAKSRGFSPALVFDIGASDGRWTKECRAIFGDAHHVMVDPLLRNRAPLQKMADLDPRITVFPGVVAARPGSVELYDHGDQSSVLKSRKFPGVLRTVEATTVDSLLLAHGSRSPILLKADVQGYELEVLKGAERCLESTEMLILEVAFRRSYEQGALAHEIISYVGQRGFRVYEICSYLQHPEDRDLMESDMVFVRESSPLFRRAT